MKLLGQIVGIISTLVVGAFTFEPIFSNLSIVFVLSIDLIRATFFIQE